MEMYFSFFEILNVSANQTYSVFQIETFTTKQMGMCCVFSFQPKEDQLYKEVIYSPLKKNLDPKVSDKFSKSSPIIKKTMEKNSLLRKTSQAMTINSKVLSNPRYSNNVESLSPLSGSPISSGEDEEEIDHPDILKRFSSKLSVRKIM
jgi:hypothetical protein